MLQGVVTSVVEEESTSLLRTREAGSSSGEAGGKTSPRPEEAEKRKTTQMNRFRFHPALHQAVNDLAVRRLRTELRGKINGPDAELARVARALVAAENGGPTGGGGGGPPGAALLTLLVGNGGAGGGGGYDTRVEVEEEDRVVDIVLEVGRSEERS